MRSQTTTSPSLPKSEACQSKCLAYLHGDASRDRSVSFSFLKKNEFDIRHDEMPSSVSEQLMQDFLNPSNLEDFILNCEHSRILKS